MHLPKPLTWIQSLTSTPFNSANISRPAVDGPVLGPAGNVGKDWLPLGVPGGEEDTPDEYSRRRDPGGPAGGGVHAPSTGEQTGRNPHPSRAFPAFPKSGEALGAGQGSVLLFSLPLRSQRKVSPTETPSGHRQVSAIPRRAPACSGCVSCLYVRHTHVPVKRGPRALGDARGHSVGLSREACRPAHGGPAPGLPGPALPLLPSVRL